VSRLESICDLNTRIAGFVGLALKILCVTVRPFLKNRHDRLRDSDALRYMLESFLRRCVNAREPSFLIRPTIQAEK
jgi:hypothetical protein